MIIAAAQTSPHLSHVSNNIEDHVKLTKLAALNGAELILFPEMSLSSYEREKAKELTFSDRDERLTALINIASEKNITIVVGAPIKIKEDLHIGCFIIKPNGTFDIYTKQNLHGGENDYFKPSFDHNPLIEINNERISVAICADINHEQHIDNAKQKKSTLYLAGIFFGNSEMDRAHDLLSNHAKKYNINVLMSNFVGNVWDMQGGGKSAFWNSNGHLIGELDNDDSGIILFKKENNNWTNIPVRY